MLHVIGVIGRASDVVGPIILVHGDGSDGHGWIGPAIIATFIASPFVVGLAWRLVDRRRDRGARHDA